jgi:hypothetical protein
MPSETPLDIVASIHEFIGDILRAQRFFWFYPENHPSFAKVLDTLFLHFRNLNQVGSVVFSVSREMLSVGAIPLDFKKKNNRDFCNLLYKRRIQTLTLNSEVTPRELLYFIHILSMDSRMVKHQGGAAKMLSNAGINNIKVTEYVYDTAEFEASREQADKNVDYLAGLSENHIRRFMEFLKGDILDLPRGYEDVFIDYLKNPRRSLELIYRSALSKAEETGENDIGREVRKCLQKLRKWLSNFSPDLKTSILRGMALIILNERRDFHPFLFKIEFTLSLDESESIKQLFADLTDDEIIDFLLKEIPALGSLESVRVVLRKMEYPPIRIDHLMGKFEMIYHQKKNQIEEEQRIREFHEQLKGFHFTGMMAEALALLFELYKNEKALPASLELLNLFERILPELVTAGMFKESLEILRILDGEISSGVEDQYYPEIKEQSHAIRFRMVNINLLEGIKRNIEGREIPPESDIVLFCRKLGEDNLKKLVEYFQKQGMGYELKPFFQLMGQMGNLIVPEAVNQVLSGNSALALEWLSLLKTVRTREVLVYLKKAYARIPVKLKPQAVSLIGSYKDPETRKWILNIFHSDASIEVKLASMEGLAFYGDEESRLFLKNWIEKWVCFNRINAQLQIKAIRLAGENDTSEWVKLLGEMGFNRFMFPPTHRKMIRLTVIQTLAKMSHPDARHLIEKGARDKRVEIRTLCENALRTNPKPLTKGGSLD